MSNSPISTRLPDGDKQRLKEFSEDEGIGMSKALERAADRGLQAYGYDGSGLNRDTYLEQAASEGARFGAYTAAALVGVQLGTELNFEPYIAAMLTMTVLMLILERNALQVSNWLPNKSSREASE